VAMLKVISQNLTHVNLDVVDEVYGFYLNRYQEANIVLGEKYGTKYCRQEVFNLNMDGSQNILVFSKVDTCFWR